ncbi:MAG: BrnT family toxin [Anaerolineales bacterium]|nr:MAG: BrnT family toxin [Anaerolineales bacterium]
MHFEWDESKSAINVRKHKIDFADVPVVFEGPMLIDYDDRQDYGEDRWIGIGLLRSIVVVVVFTERGKDTICIISARKANQNECERYYEEAI